MRFLDANVFVYAFYKPRKSLPEKEQKMKGQARKIIAGVSDGTEEVLMTVVHLSEVANVLKHGLSQQEVIDIIHGLFMLENLQIVDVSRDQYFAAVELGEDLRLEVNDALAVDFMQRYGLTEIYSFDEHFAHVEGITRLP